MCPEPVNRCTRVFAGKWYSGTDQASTPIRSYRGNRRDATATSANRPLGGQRTAVVARWRLIADTGQSGTSESRGNAVVVRGRSNYSAATDCSCSRVLISVVQPQWRGRRRWLIRAAGIYGGGGEYVVLMSARGGDATCLIDCRWKNPSSLGRGSDASPILLFTNIVAYRVFRATFGGVRGGCPYYSVTLLYSWSLTARRQPRSGTTRRYGERATTYHRYWYIYVSRRHPLTVVGVFIRHIYYITSSTEKLVQPLLLYLPTRPTIILS